MSKPDRDEAVSHAAIWGSVFLTEGTASAKARRWERVWHVQRTVRRVAPGGREGVGGLGEVEVSESMWDHRPHGAF